MMELELKHCPHCGGVAEIKIDWAAGGRCAYNVYSAVCTKCGCRTPFFDKPSDAADAWNRRATPPNNPITLDELKQMDGEPVWIVNTVSGYGDWALLNIKESEVIGIDFEGFGLLELYGDRWLAYCRRPEEVKT